jgi:hypothetical protein
MVCFLLERLHGAVRPGGCLVFTTQGETCLSHLDWYGKDFGDGEAWYRREVERSGVAFRPYPRRHRYGITIHSRSYIEQVMEARYAGLELVGFRERGWDAHQDVWAYAAT